MHTVGSKLKAFRTSTGMSQKAFAKLAGSTQSTINRYENNESEPPYRIIVWYADYFDVSLDYILCRTDNPQGKLYMYEPASFKEKMADKEKWNEFVTACFEPNSPLNAKLKEAIIKIAGGENS